MVKLKNAGHWTPNNISGLVGWFDMQDATSFTNSSGFVSSITNKATALAWTEATNRPAYLATGLNGLPCMDFDGSNDRISSTDSALTALFSSAGGYTIFYVANHDVADSSCAVFGSGNTGTSSNSNTKYWGTNITGAGVWIAQCRNGAGTSINVESSGGSNTANNVFEWYHSGTVVSLQVNGAAADPAAAAQNKNAVSANECAIGARPSSTYNAFHDGKVGELLIYSRELTTNERIDARRYLGLRWAISVS